MTLYDKILELGKLGFDIKFDAYLVGHFNVEHLTKIYLRFHGNGSTKVENGKALTPIQMQDEKFIVAVLDDLYNEIKPHCFHNQSIPQYD